MKQYTKVIVASIVAVLPVLFYFLFLNHVGINEVGVAYDSANGKITIQDTPGWYVTSPMVKVVTLPTLPQKVQLYTSANIIAVKIVKLRPEKIVNFVKMQGFGYSIHENLNSILMGYAFSGKDYDFLEIVQDSTPANNR